MTITRLKHLQSFFYEKINENVMKTNINPSMVYNVPMGAWLLPNSLVNVSWQNVPRASLTQCNLFDLCDYCDVDYVL